MLASVAGVDGSFAAVVVAGEVVSCRGHGCSSEELEVAAQKLWTESGRNCTGMDIAEDAQSCRRATSRDALACSVP